MQKELPRVDISILLWHSRPYLDELVKGLEDLDYPKDKLLIYFVKNEQEADSYGYVQKLCRGKSQYRFIDNNDNLGFCGGHNVTMRVSDAEYILLLNSDAIPKSDLINVYVDRFQRDSRLGVADCTQKPQNHPKIPDPDTGEVSFCSGACMFIRKEALKDTGLFDEKFFAYVEDVDLSWRMWSKGWKCVFVKEGVVKHYVLDHSKHKKDQVNPNEDYLMFRNDMMMRMIYRGPFIHTFHILKLMFLHIPFFRWFTIPLKYIYRPIHKFFKRYLRALKKRLPFFNIIHVPPLAKVSARIARLNVKEDRAIRVYKAIFAQYKHYPHILWRWFLFLKDTRHHYIRFYGIRLYSKRTDV